MQLAVLFLEKVELLEAAVEVSPNIIPRVICVVLVRVGPSVCEIAILGISKLLRV